MKLSLDIRSSNFKLKKDYDFARRVYQNGITPYRDRLKQYGFYGHDMVLDAGCGFGQWSLALAHLNKQVSSCDAELERVSFLRETSQNNSIRNIESMQGCINELPYNKEQFDAVFCYGVIFLTPWKQSLVELCRVLKPQGKLYINANGLGWYKHLWYTEHNKIEEYEPKLIAAQAWLNTYNYAKGYPVQFPTDIIIEPDALVNELKNLGITDIMLDGEGLLGNPNNNQVFFQKEYFGDMGVYEIIGQKS